MVNFEVAKINFWGGDIREMVGITTLYCRVFLYKNKKLKLYSVYAPLVGGKG
jgi:hypothetical protein